MKKREFLDRLKAALMNRINSQAVVENVNYYEDYINTQVRMGMKEEVVIAKLGDPRLLAKTIIDSEKRKGNATEFGETQSSTNYGNYTSEESSYDTQPKKAHACLGRSFDCIPSCVRGNRTCDIPGIFYCILLPSGSHSGFACDIFGSSDEEGLGKEDAYMKVPCFNK